MWGIGQAAWLNRAARGGVGRSEVASPGGAIEIPEEDATLWRYMDLAKLLALVGSGRLFFSAVSRLGDRFEGRWSDRTFDMLHGWDELWVEERRDEVVIEDRRVDQRLGLPRLEPTWSVERTVGHWGPRIRRAASRRTTFVSCWYEGAEESEAMWRLFTGDRYGVAVRTSAAALVGSFTERLPDYLGRVNYVAYDGYPMPVADFPPVFYKRKAFEHEREVRAVVAPRQRVGGDPTGTTPGTPGTTPGTPGVAYGIDAEQLIEAVVLSPYSPDWLLDVVESALARYGMEARVEKSVLLKRPAGETASLEAREPKAYFAFRDGKRPLRIWATSRRRAFEEARNHWKLAADAAVEVWTARECDEGYRRRPGDYERIASRHNSAMQNGLDPEPP